jgi:hypothetical protein
MAAGSLVSRRVDSPEARPIESSPGPHGTKKHTELTGGLFLIESALGVGTTVSARWPYSRW